jgi:DNA-binding MarR family transcriptional regulator
MPLDEINTAFDLMHEGKSIRSLEENGWLVRRRSTEDRRRHGLFLTPEGSRQLKQLKQQMQDSEAALGQLFDEEERRTLISLLQRIRP